MRVHVRFEDFGEREALKAARKVVRLRYAEAIREAGQRAVLPRAKRRAPGVVGHYLTTKATLRGAYLTTIGKRVYDNIAGLLNFGGYVKGKLQPKRAKALYLRDYNVVVASVGEEGKVRARYKGQHFLEAAISEGVPAMEELAIKKVAEAFRGA
ncbi:MAG TPA: hypothetical protein VFN92_13440 [Solirubrobacterales bacterium]|nr:hypothetical protein [Solirubrobacterales bacterium]